MSTISPILSSMHLVLQVLAAAQAVEKAGQRLFRPHGLTVAKFNVLNLLSDQPAGMRASDLARALVVDPSNVTGLLKRMKAEKFLKEFDSLCSKRKKGPLTSADWFDVRMIAEHMESATEIGQCLGGELFDVFRHEYRPGMFDEFGVTHLYADPAVRRNRKLKKWCVVMDMHS